MMNRRTFAASSVAAVAFLGLARRAEAQRRDATYRNEVPGYGDLVPDRGGLLDLPAGFSYRIVSSAGEAMDDGYVTPDRFDGMACFPLDRRRVALVRNHELAPNLIERAARPAARPGSIERGSAARAISAATMTDGRCPAAPRPSSTTCAAAAASFTI